MEPPSFGPRHYVPFLKTKAGELSALRMLDTQTRSALTPLFDVTPLGNDEPVARARKLVEDLLPVSLPGQPFWVDFRSAVLPHPFGGPDPMNETATIEQAHHFFEAARAYRDRLPIIPVVADNRPEALNSLAAEYAAQDGNGVGIRVSVRRGDGRQLSSWILELLETSGSDPENADLFVDARGIGGEDAGFFAKALYGEFATMPHLNDFRTVTLAASAFPENLSGQGKNSTKRYPRADWKLWELLWKQADFRMPAFADYGTESPKLSTGGPYGPAPHIRYASDDDWVVVKGDKRDGHEGFHDVAQRTTELDEFAGASFSLGDRYLHDCAGRRDGPGGPTEWRRAGTAHHLTHVVRQLGSLPSP